MNPQTLRKPKRKRIIKMKQNKFIEALEALEEVTILQRGECYDWEEFRVYVDPKTDSFYWGNDAGCSCNYWFDTATSLGDLESGRSTDVFRALRKLKQYKPEELCEARGDVQKYLDKKDRKLKS